MRELEAYQDAVYAICYQVLRHAQDAEDAAQEALAKAARRLGSVRDRDRLGGWLYRVAFRSALDLKRRRQRAWSRERAAVAGRAQDAGAGLQDLQEEVERALAKLDEVSRAYVVEHYYGGRTLREIAEARGISEQAVWKRIERAKERLREKPGLAAVAGLERMPRVKAPEGLLGRVAAAVKPGVGMGLKLAWVAPLVLLVGGAGLVRALQQGPEPAKPPSGSRPSAVRSSPVDRPAASGVRPAQEPSPPRRATSAQAARVRKPYPLELPGPDWTREMKRSWALLNESKIGLEGASSPMEALERISRETGLRFHIDPSAMESLRARSTRFALNSVTLVAVLQLTLGPMGLAYDLRSDGSIDVAPAGAFDRASRGALHGIRSLRAELEEAARRLEEGWDGKDPRMPLEIRMDSVRIRRDPREVEVRTLLRELSREARVNLSESRGSSGPTGGKSPFLETIVPLAEGTLKEHLEYIAVRTGLGYVIAAEEIYLTSREEAVRARQEQEARYAEHRARLASLDRTFEAPAGLLVPDFAEALERALGLAVVPSKAAWECEAPVQGRTFRECLDGLSAAGVRWALRDGRIFLVK